MSDDPKGEIPSPEPEPIQAEGKKKKKKKDGFGSARGVETMFRTSYRTHQDLSKLADNKANIMISINGIILSILLASIYDRIVANQWLLLPTAVLSMGCVLSLVYAVLAARPRVTQGKATLEDVREDRANILFFGTFTNMSEEEYYLGMRELIAEPGTDLREYDPGYLRPRLRPPDQVPAPPHLLHHLHVRACLRRSSLPGGVRWRGGRGLEPVALNPGQSAGPSLPRGEGDGQARSRPVRLCLGSWPA